MQYLDDDAIMGVQERKTDDLSVFLKIILIQKLCDLFREKLEFRFCHAPYSNITFSLLHAFSIS